MQVITSFFAQNHAALSASMVSIPLLVWALYAGFVIGVLVMYYNKTILGKAIRALLEKGAIGEENARTSEELGIARSALILHSIHKGTLGRYIRILPPSDENSAERYFLNEEDRIRAELRYSNKGSDLYVVIMALVIFLLIAFLAARYLPMLLDLAGDLLS